ncbi:hypothetical protein [Yonghaparkia sp. Soil809]|uniref:hypothetical protein n=1 Tax=Yonghaparkia sp. Soil809 TaxID=1736417 RepID=UPI0006F3879E|nr:hypothetical protein [Yonghaparkia sp. Soil809]KRF32990.1 hypothetical protein ASG83_02985 [Yonghaparkia sp. Soil809]
MTPDDAFEIVALRTSVFSLEQRIDEEGLDARDRDESTLHVWIRDDAGVASSLRVLENDEPRPGDADARRLIGRVVTRADRRGRLRALQDEHFEAGIPHIGMRRAPTA